MLNRRALSLAAIAAFTTLLGGCATTATPVSVADTLANTPTLSTLSGLVVKAGLSDALKGAGPFTVFAPSNDAFAAVPAKTLEELGKDPAKLEAVLKFHVVGAQLLAADVKNGPAKSLQGADLALSKAGSFVTVEEAVVLTADIKASNGVVHIVDRVLLPPAKH